MTTRNSEHAGVWILRPEVPYAAVHGAAVTSGWIGGPVTLTPPLIRDEPELARFRRDAEVATYELNPVAMLRTWRGAPPPEALPLVAPDEVLQELAELKQTSSTDSLEGLLRAVLAAGDFGLGEAVPRLHVIRRRGLPVVVADALEASLRRIAASKGNLGGAGDEPVTGRRHSRVT